jgi:hypothetical protein
LDPVKVEAEVSTYPLTLQNKNKDTWSQILAGRGVCFCVSSGYFMLCRLGNHIYTIAAMCTGVFSSREEE